MPELEPFLGTGLEKRASRTRALTLLPYLVGGTLCVAAPGRFNPHGPSLVLISGAAASFGGTSLLAWYPRLWARRPPACGPTGRARSTPELGMARPGAVVLHLRGLLVLAWCSAVEVEAGGGVLLRSPPSRLVPASASHEDDTACCSPVRAA